MKIVVCDDDEKFLKEFKTVLQERLTSLEIEAELTMYSTGKKLVEVCEQEEIDVLFLDIDMPEVDGFKIAESVRKKERNCLIVFCSNYSDFVFKSFRYEPFSFLCKENYQEQLSDVMKRIYEKWNSREKEFTYQIIIIRNIQTMLQSCCIYMMSKLTKLLNFFIFKYIGNIAVKRQFK